MIAPGQRATLRIDKPAAGGRMIGRLDGQVVLVSGAIPGETVRAVIERVGRGVAYAATIEVVDGSPDRRVPFTDPQCGGVLFAHVAYARQLALKQEIVADAFGRLGRLPLGELPPIAASPEAEYRMRARLHVRNGRCGFFREGSHQLCDAAATRQLRADALSAVDRLVRAATTSGAPESFDVEISENADASHRVVHLDADVASVPGGVCAGVSGVTARAAPHGRPPQPPGFARLLHGEPYVTDRLDVAGVTVELRRHVLAFFQGNRYLLTRLVAAVVGLVDEGAAVADLYAGVGLFAISAAMVRGAHVTAVEGDPVAADDLVFNAARSGGQVAARAQAVETLRPSGEAPAAVIVDPPRTGMSREALAAMLRLGSRRIVYVSCDVATLARDARRIVDAGYVLQQVRAFDLFPNTPHVETVAEFAAARPSSRRP